MQSFHTPNRSLHQSRPVPVSSLPANAIVLPRNQIQQSIIREQPIEDRPQEQELDEDYKSDKRVINFFILILPLILAILFLIAAGRLVDTQLDTNTQLEGADNVLHFVHHNLNSNPVQSWDTTQHDDCPSNYEEAELGEWKGIQRGCVCKNGDTYNHSNYYKCLSLSDQCQSENGEGDEDYDFWVSSTTRFCENRLGSEQWERVAHCDTTKNTQCANSVCLSGLNAQCPPNVVKVDKLSDPSANLKTLLKDFTTDTTSNESQLTITPAQDGQKATIMSSKYDSTQDKTKNTAIVGFVVSQGKTLCLNDEYTATTNAIYTLDEQQTNNKKCDQYGELNAEQVTVLDNAKQSVIFSNNEKIQDAYNSGLPHFNPSEYTANTLNLLAVEKIPLADKPQCDKAYNHSLNHAGSIASSTRTGLRFFAYFILVFASITVLLGIIFLLSATFQAPIKSQENIRKLASLYWLSAWILVFIGILTFIIYWTVFRYWQGDNQEELQTILSNNCFPGNAGINQAITKLKSFDQETEDTYGPYVEEFFWYAIIYAFVWMMIIGIWKYRHGGKSSGLV